jgi:HlyD family secretion protein
MKDDKTRLLHSLAIDRGEPAVATSRARRSRLWLPSVALVAAGLGAAAWSFAPAMRESAPATVATGGLPTTADAQPSQAKDQSQITQPLAESRRAGGLAASGYVVARRKATVAAEITGKVTELLIEEGQVVQEGQVIARLDSVLAEKDLALAQSRAAAAAAAVGMVSADLRDAERIYTRIHSLSQKSFASEADLTKAEARMGVLRAQLAQSQAQLETARLDAQRNAAVLEKHHIRAPFGGVVIERSAQPGEMISPMSAGGFTRTGICTIVDMDSIEVEVDVNEAFIGRVRAGGPVTAVLDAYPGWTIPASVIAIVPTANREKATVKVRIGFKQKDTRILPDMGVKVTFLDDAAVSLPSAEASASLRD